MWKENIFRLIEVINGQTKNTGEYLHVGKVRYAFLYLKMLLLVPSAEDINDEQKS